MHLSIDGDSTFSGQFQGAKGTFASEGTFEGEGTTTTIDRVLTVENQYFQSSLRPENLFFSYKGDERGATTVRDRKSTRLNSSHVASSYAVFCLKKKKSEKYRKA